MSVLFFKPKTAYEMRISDWSSDVCSSDLIFARELEARELLETRTAGWTDLRAALRPLTPEVAAGRCGIAPGTIRDLAERFVRARTSACYGRVGTNRGR